MDLVKVLESYRGKDRIIRLSTYVCMLIGGGSNTPFQAKFRKISTELSGCRVTLRLFDDFSALMLNLSKGFGFKEPNPWLRPLEVVGSVMGQLYYPVEHLAWLRDRELVPGKSQLLWLASLVIWIANLLIEIARSIIKLRVNSLKAYHLKKQKHLEKTEDMEMTSQQTEEIKTKLKQLAAERQDLVLAIVQSGADLFNAISWLPPGVLWSRRVAPSVNGFFGIISSLALLYRNWPTK